MDMDATLVKIGIAINFILVMQQKVFVSIKCLSNSVKGWAAVMNDSLKGLIDGSLIKHHPIPPTVAKQITFALQVGKTWSRVTKVSCDDCQERRCPDVTVATYLHTLPVHVVPSEMMLLILSMIQSVDPS